MLCTHKKIVTVSGLIVLSDVEHRYFCPEKAGHMSCWLERYIVDAVWQHIRRMAVHHTVYRWKALQYSTVDIPPSNAFLGAWFYRLAGIDVVFYQVVF